MDSSCKAFRVMAGCFGPGLERTWLTELAAAEVGVSLTFVESRTSLNGHARMFRPGVVLLPLRDASGMPSAPLIARLHEDLPNVRLLVLMAPGTMRVGIGEAIRAGAEPAIVNGAAELSAVLRYCRPMTRMVKEPGMGGPTAGLPATAGAPACTGPRSMLITKM